MQTSPQSDYVRQPSHVSPQRVSITSDCAQAREERHAVDDSVAGGSLGLCQSRADRSECLMLQL